MTNLTEIRARMKRQTDLRLAERYAEAGDLAAARAILADFDRPVVIEVNHTSPK